MTRIEKIGLWMVGILIFGTAVLIGVLFFNTGRTVDTLDRNTDTVGKLQGDVANLGNRVGALEQETQALGKKEVVAKVAQSDLEPLISLIKETKKEDREQLIKDMEDMGKKLPEAIIAELVRGGYISKPSAASPTPTPPPTATPSPTATVTPAPMVMPATPTPTTIAGGAAIPKEAVYTVRIEQEKDGEKVLLILSNPRTWSEDPGCPKESLAQPAKEKDELRRCLTTKTRAIEWLGVSTLPMAGREWMVLDQTVFRVTKMGEEPLGRKPAFWFQVRPSTDTRLVVELQAGALNIEGIAEPGGDGIESSGRILSKVVYLAWIQQWTKQAPPSHLISGVYAVYPPIIER